MVETADSIIIVLIISWIVIQILIVGIPLIFKYKSFKNDLEEARLALTSTDKTPVPAYRPIIPKRKHGITHDNTRKRVKSMNEKDFLEWCKKEVVRYTNKHLDKSDNKKITSDDVFMVWCCKTLQNNKALLSTTLFDGMYYECTYNGDNQEMYIDVYKKWENFTRW